MEEWRKSKSKRIGKFYFETWLFPERPWQIRVGASCAFVTLFGRVFWAHWI